MQLKKETSCTGSTSATTQEQIFQIDKFSYKRNTFNYLAYVKFPENKINHCFTPFYAHSYKS